jgi:hypothetical protein
MAWVRQRCLWLSGFVLVFFVLVVSSAWGLACPNEDVRVGASAGLPDCRAYELVTPAEKNSGKVYFTGVGSDEETVTFTSLAGFGGVEGGEGVPGFVYIAERSPGGWVTSPVVPSASRFLDLNASLTTRSGPVLGQSSDGRLTLWLLHEYGQPANSAGFYLTGPGGSAVEVGPATPPGSGPVISGHGTAGAPVEVVGVSADGSRVFFRLLRNPSEALHEWSLGQPGVGGPGALLEYVGVGNTSPEPVGVDDGGGSVEGCSSQELGGELRSQAVANTGHTGQGELYWTHNAVSLDGRRVFFTDVCPGTHQIFARIDNGEPGASTVAVSEPSKEDCSACETFESEPAKRSAAYFVAGSDTGSKVFFTTSQPLLDSAEGENVYEYNFEPGVPHGQRVTRVSAPDDTVASPGAADVQGVVQVSEDGSHVYFVARGILTSSPNNQGQRAVLGAYNLYVFDTETNTTAFIATLASNDIELWKGHGSFRPFPVASNVTPDGDFLVFTSHADLTPDDTSTAAQIFEYDAASGSLVRVSVGQDLYNDDGNTQLAGIIPAEQDSSLEDPNDALLPEFTAEYEDEYSAEDYGRELAVSADGSYVFFESSDGLTPQAVNRAPIRSVEGGEAEEAFGVVYAENVYEYHDGNVSLISDGRDVSAGLSGSYVVLDGTDPSGRDVFFTTTDQLVGQDTDSQVDIYDARIDGGFGAPEEGLGGCDGDACQGALSGSPVLLSPSSEFQSGGNPSLANTVSSTTKTTVKKTVKSKAKKKTRGKKGKRKAAAGKSGQKGRKARRAVRSSAGGRGGSGVQG